jgi:hypothetical protein
MNARTTPPHPANAAEPWAAGSEAEAKRRSSRGPDTVPSVVLATHVQTLVASAIPVVLAIGFGALLVLRRRDRRRGETSND